ncbi:hypothetical protein DOE76_09125 [Leifsonia sp. ku-ls]|nr:hypothetical protein DOE76_09125 [Leifsonia sp. ku-ls]
MSVLVTRLLRVAPRIPLTLVVSAGGAGAAVAQVVWAGEIELAGAPFSVVSWLLLIGSLATAEWRFGSRRTLTVASIGTAVGVGLAWAFLSGLAALGEPLAEEAVRYQPWTPSVTTAALLAAASCTLRPAARRSLRWVVGTAVVAMLLTSGHASDVARALAAGAGLAAGIVARRAVPGEAWRPSGRARWRSVLASSLVIVASALALASVTPNATGVLAWTGAVVDPTFAPLVAGMLAVGAALILGGRLVGVLVGGGALVVVAVAALVGLVIAPALSDGIDWSDLTGADAEWQLVALLAGGLPALLVLLVLLGARAALRRPVPQPTTEDRRRLAEVLRESGDGSFAHMATWAGNSVWFGRHGNAIAYRVRDGVAFTVGDPIGPRQDEAALSFARFCDERGWTPVFYSVHDAAAAALEQAGWTRTPVGTEAVLDTASFTLTGRKRQDLRTAVNRAEREGMSAVWTTYRDCDPAIRRQIDTLCAGWVDGKRLPEMGFTLGGLAELDDPDVRLMVALAADGRVHAVTSWLPRRKGGDLVGWTLDVMRRDRAGMPGAMEFAIVSTIRRAAEEGVSVVSLSGTPLAAHDGAATGRVVGRLRRLLEPAYGFASLERFKAKFGARPEPLWMCFPQPMQLGRIAPALLRVYVPDLRLTRVVGALRATA